MSSNHCLGSFWNPEGFNDTSEGSWPALGAAIDDVPHFTIAESIGSLIGIRPTKRHGNSVERLERRWRLARPRLAILVVYPDDWPASDRAAFDSGDAERQDTVIERHTGQRPGPFTRLIVFRFWEVASR
jgi:hypothetical protein